MSMRLPCLLKFSHCSTHELWVAAFDRFLVRIYRFIFRLFFISISLFPPLRIPTNQISLKIDKAHLFGTALGGAFIFNLSGVHFSGYLSLCFAQNFPRKVLSVILCNSFADTSRFANNLPLGGLVFLTPKFLLEGILMQNYPSGEVPVPIADSVDFSTVPSITFTPFTSAHVLSVVKALKSLKHSELASRILLNCSV